MVETGLSSEEMEMIRRVFEKNHEITRVVLYGSRAKGSYRPESDVDFAVQGSIAPLRVESLAADLEELPLPYRFDVRSYTAIQSRDLLDHIDGFGLTVYEQEI